VAGDGSLITFPINTQSGALVRLVRNKTGATLTKGTVVYIDGATGNNPTVAKAQGNTDATSAQTFGLCQANISNNATGYVVVAGDLIGLDTSSFTEGAQLYLSPTLAGTYTTTKQYAPNHLVYVGVVTRSHPNLGQIEVKIQNGYEMDELHNVDAFNPSNNDGIFYNSTTSLWEHKPISTVLGYTPSNDSLVVHLAGTETITGAKTFRGTTASDTAPLGSELAAVTAGGTNWAVVGTNLNAGGYSHTVGSTADLTTSLAAVSGTYYQIAYTITNRTTGSITINYGGIVVSGISASGNTGPLASSTAALTITPTTDFNGTVALSIKSIGTSSATTTFANSSGTSNIEVRASSDTSNTFIGLNAGQRNTTGVQNTFIGNNAGRNNTNGAYNTFIGIQAGQSNTTGTYNTFFGLEAGQNNTTGFENVFIGVGAGNNNTTSYYNTSIGVNAGRSNTTGVANNFFGNNAGRWIANGSTLNSITDNSIYIGYNTKALANNQTNQIVIGHSSTGLGSNTTVLGNSSTATTAIYGNLLLGSTTDTGERLQITGSTIFKSLTGASDRVIYVTSTGVVTAATIGSGLSFSAGTLSATGTASGSIGGSGTSGFVPKFTGTAAIGNSNIQDSGTLITLGSNTTISSGGLGIGTTDLTGYNLRIAKNITGLTAAYGVFVDSIIQSDVTSNAYGYRTNLTTTSATFTLANIIHYGCNQPALGANSTVTLQTGFLANSTMVGAATNYGFRGIIPSGTNRWNIYMDGTAANYLEGDTAIGTTSLATATKFTLAGSETASSAIARGQLINTTLVASANNDVLVGLDIAPTFTNGAFTGVQNYALRVNSTSVRSLVYFNNTTTWVGNQYSLEVGGYTLLNGIRFNGADPVRGIYTPTAATQLGIATNSADIVFSTDGGGSTVKAAFKLNTGNLILQNGGTFTDAGFRLDVAGTTRFQGTTASDTAPLGAEIATTGTGTNWTGTAFSTGYTHTVGSTANLTDSSVAVIGTTYRVAVTITGRTAGSISIFYGGENYVTGQSTTRQWARQAITTAGLVVTPTSDFDGTVVFNINSVGNSSPSITFSSSNGTTITEMRNGISGTGNLFIGTNAGRKGVSVLSNNIQNTFIGNFSGQNNSNGRNNTLVGYNSGAANSSGSENTAIGTAALQFNTTAGESVAVGSVALANNTTGGANSAVGFGASNLNTTGSLNSVLGQNALFNNTTGNNNIAIGGSAGRFIANGSTANTIANQSIYIGDSTKALADNQANQIVIGHSSTGLGSNTTVLGNSSTVTTAIYGDLLLGGTTPITSALLAMTSTTEGFLPPRMTTTQKNAISSPATGLVVFDTTLGKLCVFSTTWQTISSV
jgi:hypothetical protein